MLRFAPRVTRKDRDSEAEKRPTFGARKLEPRLESSFVFPAEKYIGLKLNDRKKGKKPVSKKD